MAELQGALKSNDRAPSARLFYYYYYYYYYFFFFLSIGKEQRDQLEKNITCSKQWKVAMNVKLFDGFVN